MVHISRFDAANDVTDLFFLHSCWSRRKEICRVTWHNCNLAFVHSVCHHFIYVSLILNLILHINYVRTRVYSYMFFFFMLVTCWSMHLQLAVHSKSISSSVCLSELEHNTCHATISPTSTCSIHFFFSNWLPNVVIYFKCGHSEIWIDNVQVRVDNQTSNFNWLPLASFFTCSRRKRDQI